MTPEDQTLFKILIWAFPIMLTVLGFIGALGVKALISMSKTLNEINTQVAVIIQKHDDLERRVERIEEEI